jgi:hypothetical protein
MRNKEKVKKKKTTTEDTTWSHFNRVHMVCGACQLKDRDHDLIHRASQALKNTLSPFRPQTPPDKEFQPVD